MTALSRYFFDAVYLPRSRWAVVQWWESRRLAYNVAVGAAGLASIGFVQLVSMLPPFGGAPAGFPWGGALVYGLIANAAYSLGPAAELLIRRVWGPTCAEAGPALLRYGFVFSIGLTLLPIPVVLVGLVLRVLSGI